MATVYDHIVSIKSRQADDPDAESHSMMAASQAAMIYPHMESIITHPDFRSATWIIDLEEVTITHELDNVFDDGIDPTPPPDDSLPF